MNIEHTEQDGVTILKPIVKNVDTKNIEEFRSQMKQALEGTTHVVVNMEEIQFLDSSGLGAFLSGMRDVTSKGGDLHLCGVTPPVRTLFELVRLHRIMDIHESLEGAVASARD